MKGTVIRNLKLTKVVDGDTIKILLDNNEESIRFVCLDTEESQHGGSKPVTNAGILASKWAKEYFGANDRGIPNGDVRVDLEFDTDDPVDVCLRKHRGNYGKEYFKDKLRFMFLALAVVLFGLLMALFPSPAQAKVWHELDGNAEDVNPQLIGPAYDLGGGGVDVDRASQWTIDQVRDCEDCSKTVDLVVLRFLTDADQKAWDRYGEEPNIQADYLGYHELLPSDNSQPKLQGLDSIETFVFSNPGRQDADDADIAEAIEKAEFVFFAGGDQCKYARNFKGTAIESAIESVQARGGAIGGTSAGAMIQGEWIFNACSEMG